MFSFLDKIESWRDILKYTVILIVVIIASALLYGLFGIIKSTGLIENKDKKIAQLQSVNKAYEESNYELIKAIKEVKKHNEVSLKVVSEYEDKKVKLIKKNYEIKKEIKKKEEKIKKTKTVKPKESTNNLIKIDRYKYIEVGKVHINSIWNMYDEVKGGTNEKDTK